MTNDDQSRVSATDAAQFANLLLMRATGHGIIFIASDGTVTGWSRGAAYITGFLPADVIGMPLAELFAPEDRQLGLPEQELRVASTVGYAEDERWHVRRDGSRFWASGLTYAQRDAEGALSGYVKVFRDATHLRTRVKYLENVIAQRATRQVEHAAFIGTIAHELRNPLQPIKTVLALLRASADPAGRQAEPLKVLGRQLGVLERLVEDLVDLTRTSTGKMRVDPRTVVIQEVIHNAISDCESKSKAKGVRLHAVLPDQPLLADVDPGRLEQVVVNLVTNGIKFTPEGGNVWVTCTTDHAHLLITVQDDGRGIPPDLLPGIFDAFTQAENVPAGRGDGLGIGLSVVKEIVTLHGGSVEVRSEGPGKGAEFTVRTPLRRQAIDSFEEAGGRVEATPAPSPDSGDGGRR